MPIADPKYKRLTAENVERAPQKSGVFALYDHDVLVYLGLAAGQTDTLRSVLKGHVGTPGAGPTRATRYKREASGEPQARLDLLMAEFVAAHGARPRDNVVASA